MRHGNRLNKLSRTTAHRHALMMNLGNALVLHKRIITTTAKAKALRGFIEPIITRAKENTTHNRREIFARLRDKNSIESLFDTIGPKVATRNGGYTRIIKIGARPGDNADMALIELVDFSLNATPVEAGAAAATAEPKKRTRRAGAKKPTGTTGTTKTTGEKKVAKPTTSKAAAPKIRQRKSGGA